MKKWIRYKNWRAICIILCFISCLHMPIFVYAAPELVTPSYILIETSTGTVICEKNADERRSPASITKLMTLYLIFKNIEQGKINYTDIVTTSAYAKSMGGSQVFLEEGESQSVETLIKCIAVASGNDASVAMAEYIGGSEEGFVELMNAEAESMGMTNTHFEDCCGLSDSDNHYTSARDVATISRALLLHYPEVTKFTQIWMEDMVHETRNGSNVFTLSSTNKLLKMYEWTTGLKTGSTAKAKYCLSASASRDKIDLVAVVMASPSNKERFQDALTLLSYGYSVSQIYEDKEGLPLPAMEVVRGVKEQVNLCYQNPFRYVDVEGNDLSKIEKHISLQEYVEAPVEEGQAVGEIVYSLNGKRIGSCSVLTTSRVEKMRYLDAVRKTVFLYLNTA